MQSYGQCRVPNQLLMRFCDGSDAGLEGTRQSIRLCNTEQSYGQNYTPNKTRTPRKMTIYVPPDGYQVFPVIWVRLIGPLTTIVLRHICKTSQIVGRLLVFIDAYEDVLSLLFKM